MIATGRLLGGHFPPAGLGFRPSSPTQILLPTRRQTGRPLHFHFTPPKMFMDKRSSTYRVIHSGASHDPMLARWVTGLIINKDPLQGRLTGGLVPCPENDARLTDRLIRHPITQRSCAVRPPRTSAGSFRSKVTPLLRARICRRRVSGRSSICSPTHFSKALGACPRHGNDE